MATATAGLTWWEVLFGVETVTEFAPPTITEGDVIIDNGTGVQWQVRSIHQEAPYTSLPIEYAAYTLTEAWAFLVRVTDDSAFALSDYAPVRYLQVMSEME